MGHTESPMASPKGLGLEPEVSLGARRKPGQVSTSSIPSFWNLPRHCLFSSPVDSMLAVDPSLSTTPCCPTCWGAQLPDTQSTALGSM